MKKVLLATDGSSHAEEAAWFLAHLPHDDTLELTVLTIVHVPYASRSYSTPEWILECLEREKARAATDFQKIEQMFVGANVRLHHVVREGHRGETIVETAKEQNVDLVVVGAHGHSAVSRLLLGSTSDFVATHALCSVLVVRPTGIRESKRPIRITIGYEETGPSRAALEEIGEINWGRETDFRVISVSYIAGFFDESVRNTTADAVEKAADQLRDVAPNVQAHLVENDHIGEGLVQFAEEHASDLFVVGETPHSTLGRLLLGSVSRFVLRHAPCSVWITRNRTIHGTHKEHSDSQVASS